MSPSPSEKRGAPSQVMLVDDEQSVLDGLRRMLRRHRDRYEFSFFSSPTKAAEALENAHYDVIITDMRMPEMNGVELLERARVSCPGCVRIILSGHGELSAIMKSVGPSHQFLSKPCDGERIISALDRACGMRKELANSDLLDSLGKIETLPTIPDLYTQLIDALKSEASLKRIGEIISQDIGLSTKMLQLVNSSYFGLPQEITDPTRAVMLLGGDTISSLVLGTKLFEQLPPFDCSRFTAQQILSHSSRVAGLASRFCTFEDQSDIFRSQATTSGFLHEIGLIVLATYRRDDLEAAFEWADSEKCPLPQAELSVLGATHGQVGAYLAALWNFPDPVIEAIMYCDRPSACSQRELSPLTVVHAADAFAGGYHGGKRTEDLLDAEYLEEMNLGERVASWLAMLQDEVEADA